MRATNEADPARFARLTEGQRECLRLVYRHLSSKDIARELGISPHTVDARLRAAIRVLGSANRTDAALQLAAHEGDAYQPLVYQSPYIVPSGQPASIDPTTDGGQPANDQADAYDLPHTSAPRQRRVAEAVASFDLGGFDHLASSRPAVRLWGGRNDLSPLARIGVVMAIAIGSALAFGAILSGLESLARLS